MRPRAPGGNNNNQKRRKGKRKKQERIQQGRDHEESKNERDGYQKKDIGPQGEGIARKKGSWLVTWYSSEAKPGERSGKKVYAPGRDK